MKIGANVEWTSQARGVKKTKFGTLLAVVPANTDLQTVVVKKVNAKKFDTSPVRNTIEKRVKRKEKTYLVAVDTGAKRKKVSWPRAKDLTQA